MTKIILKVGNGVIELSHPTKTPQEMVKDYLKGHASLKGCPSIAWRYHGSEEWKVYTE